MESPMSAMPSVTGSHLRDVMLWQAIEAHGTDLDVLTAALPGDFATDAEEISRMVEAMTRGETVETPPSSSNDDAAPEPPTLSLVEAQAALAHWQHKTQLART